MKDAMHKRTTLRLPSELHRQLKVAAAEHHMTCEDILVIALRRELDRLLGPTRRTIPMPGEMNAALAELFLQSMPTFALIKDRRAKIVWVNWHFEKALDVPLRRIIGSTITEAGLFEGLQKETIDENIRQALRSRRPTMSIEGMVLKGTAVVSRAQRFVFAGGYLGDVSFVEHEIKDRIFPVEKDVLDRMQRTIPEPGIEPLFLQFLEKAPISMAIKRPLGGDSTIVWANEQFRRLTRARKTSSLFGQTTRAVFRLKSGHPILMNEAEVVHNGVARMAKETLPDHAPRWSLRFPIFDLRQEVTLLGVVSPDFQQNAAV